MDQLHGRFSFSSVPFLCGFEISLSPSSRNTTAGEAVLFLLVSFSQLGPSPAYFASSGFFFLHQVSPTALIGLSQTDSGGCFISFAVLLLVEFVRMSIRRYSRNFDQLLCPDPLLLSPGPSLPLNICRLSNPPHHNRVCASLFSFHSLLPLSPLS